MEIDIILYSGFSFLMVYYMDEHFLSIFSYEKFSNGEILIGIADPCSKSKPVLVKSDMLHEFNMEHFRKDMIW